MKEKKEDDDEAYVKTTSLFALFLQKIKFDEQCRRTWSASKRTAV